MDHGLTLYEAAVRLHEKHARDARKLGYEGMAKRAELRAGAAQGRADSIRAREGLLQNGSGSAASRSRPAEPPRSTT